VIPGENNVSCGDHGLFTPNLRLGAIPGGCLLRRFLRLWCAGICAALWSLPQRDVRRVVEVMLPRREGVSRSDFRTVADTRRSPAPPLIGLRGPDLTLGRAMSRNHRSQWDWHRPPARHPAPHLASVVSPGRGAQAGVGTKLPPQRIGPATSW
jgi:hypothetical protein